LRLCRSPASPQPPQRLRHPGVDHAEVICKPPRLILRAQFVERLVVVFGALFAGIPRLGFGFAYCKSAFLS